MKRITLIIIFFTALQLNAQVITLNTGLSASKFSWNATPLGYTPQDEVARNSSVFLGVTYYNKRHFSFSSNIGYVSKKHSGLVYFPCGANAACQGRSVTVLNYVSINTTIDLKYPTRSGIVPFIAAGPRVDILVANKSNAFSYFQTQFDVNQIQYGCTLGFGIRYEISNVQIGLRTDFLLNFNNTSELKFETINETFIFSERTQFFGFTLGYKLK